MIPHRPALPRLLALGLVVLSTSRAARADGTEVAVVYSKRLPESRAVAEYYALQRDVPGAQVIGLDLESPSGVILRPDYERQVQAPLIAELQARGLMQFATREVPASNGIPAHTAYRCTGSKIRYLLLAWGMPFRINEDARLVPLSLTNLPPQLRRNEASVDNELMLLPSAGSYELTGVTPNPYHATTNSAWYHPTNGVVMVSRLDGPTPALAKGLVDKALFAERHGLCGNAYIDLRNITSGAYKTGDDWITNTASACKRLGFSTYVDNRPETLPPTFPMSHVALYFGWYSWSADGPFLRPEVEFMPGAIAYHLHSFSAADPRSTTANWVGPFIAKGATATMGCVAEPYLDLTPNPHILFELLAARRYTFGEAGIACQRVISWMNILVGDPLYQPFKHHWFELEPQQAATGHTNLEWSVLRHVNTLQYAGRDPSALREFLLAQRLTTNSAVLSEKLATLFADDGKLKEAIAWGSRAADLTRSLQQRTRVRLNLASWQEMRDQREDALATLLKVEEERADYRDLAAFRQKQLTLAREVRNKAEVERLQAEVKRLAAAAAAATPPK